MAENSPSHVVDMVSRLSEQNGNLDEAKMRAMVRRAVERSTRQAINHMGNWLGEKV